MTELVRSNPFDDMLKLSASMQQIFNHAFVPLLPYAQRGSLPLDVAETDNSYIVQVSIPGVNVADLDIEARDQVLTIRGAWKRAEQPSDAAYHLLECPTGRFERSVQFPLPFNADAVQTTYSYGVLTLTLPKVETAKPRKIMVQSQPQQIEANAA